MAGSNPQEAITSRTRLFALTHASNVLGTVQPVAEVGRLARERDLLFLVDAAQTAGVLPIDVRALHIDLLALPGHKSLLGPTGTGALYVGPRATLRAWREGGTGGDSSSETQPREFPYFLEGGTPNVLGVAGLAAGVKYVQEQGLEQLHRIARRIFHQNLFAAHSLHDIVAEPRSRFAQALDGRL